jgi:hypothetical protein
MIAVWDCGPPPAVTSARTLFGIQGGGVGRGQVLGHQDERFVGRGMPGAGTPRSSATMRARTSRTSVARSAM